MILEAAVQYLVETLIQQVVVRVIGMLNPVGAIAQAIDLIYQVCSWIFRNAARIFRFVEAIVNGMADVIAGNIGGLAAAVERSLASLIPPVIDFLAGLCHLGGLPGEIADVITRMQAVVYAAMDRVIGFLAERGRALLARMGIGGDPEEAGHNDDSEPRHDGALQRRPRGPPHVDRPLRERCHPHGRLHPDGDPRQGGRVAGAAVRHRERRGPLGGRGQGDRGSTGCSRRWTPTRTRSPRPSRRPTATRATTRSRRLTTRSSPGSAVSPRSCASASRLFEEKDPDEYLRDIASHLQGHGSEYAATVASQWEPTIGRAKVAPDGTTPIWEPSVVSTDGARAYLGQGSTHRRLLPWFLVGSQRNPRSASSGTFKNHAFETDSPDPAHTVRTDFLRVLGSDTVTRMVRVANRTITTEDNSALLRQIQTMTYTASGGRWGSFVGLPADVVNPLIKTAITRAGDVIAFLRAMVSPGRLERGHVGPVHRRLERQRRDEELRQAALPQRRAGEPRVDHDGFHPAGHRDRGRDGQHRQHPRRPPVGRRAQHAAVADPLRAAPARRHDHAGPARRARSGQHGGYGADVGSRRRLPRPGRPDLDDRHDGHGGVP